MIKFLVLGLIICLVVFTLSVQPEYSQGVEPTPTPVIYKEKYTFKFWKVIDTSKLKLIPNFDLKKSTSELITENNCKAGINGGFYSEENEPIGEFISDEMVISKYRENKLLNGFIRIGNDNTVSIDYQAANPEAKIILQTGPILIKNKQIVKLALIRDKPARRMIAGLNTDNQLIFASVFNPDSVLDGPMLADTAKWLSDLNLTEAINLDGGSASAFFSPELKINEWQTVGSWWCLTQ